MSATAEVNEIAVGSLVKLDGETFTVETIEEGKLSRRADQNSREYEAALKTRQLNRYMELSVASFERGDTITERWSCLRLKSRTRHWNVYVKYTVEKGEL